jgi:hypothetical protein
MSYTVGDLKRALAKFDNDLVIIYSHDDEGNEFQKVINMPSIAFIKKQKSHRFLDVVDEDYAEKYPTRYEKCVCIN